MPEYSVVHAAAGIFGAEVNWLSAVRLLVFSQSTRYLVHRALLTWSHIRPGKAALSMGSWK